MIATTVDVIDGRREAWLVIDLVGGWVCAEPDPARPDGMCGMPVESEPCNIHHPDQQVPSSAAPYLTGGEGR